MNVNLFEPRLFLLLHSPSGPVVQFIERLGEDVLAGAKVQCHWDPNHDYERYPLHLRETIHMRPYTRGVERGVEVGSEQDYALAHHDGTPTRVLTPAPGKRFAWRDRITGRWIVLPVGRSVVQPPIPPNPYLKDQLERVMSKV